MASPLSELLEIDVAINVAMDELYGRVAENVYFGGAPYYLNRMPTW